MKKIRLAVILLLSALLLAGCDSIFNNEIHNKSYHAEINITEFEELVQAAIEKVAPAVVGVSNYQRTFGSSRLVSTGSGVVYSCRAKMKDGSFVNDCAQTIDSDDVDQYEYKVITNRHVIENADTIKIYFGETDRRVNAELIEYDDKVDLAVLSFNYAGYIQPLEFADSEAIKAGSFAIAIGNPAGHEYYDSCTFGIISHPKRYFADDLDGDGISEWDNEYIQHDVAINPGNSGGALINLEGKLIGINTLKLLSEDIDNMGFAIPSNVVRDIVSILETGRKPTRFTLGVQGISVSMILHPEDYAGEIPDVDLPEDIEYGFYIDKVETTGKANGYLLKNDIILEANGRKLIYIHVLRGEINKTLAGDTLVLKVYRNGEIITVNIVF
ncbi:MAG TPA: trypsin-like serine protease [Acholeplasmataceae bacterium]|jgi:serine protease Do|nr:trypsin-like serine protease [Acholeplasmataceae bacterium]